MRKLPKIIITSFLIIFLLQLIGFGIILIYPNNVNAEDKPLQFTPQITIGSFIANTAIPVGNETTRDGVQYYSSTLLKNYIIEIYDYAIGIVGIVAAIMLMVGGVRWLAAGGNASAVGDAKGIIIASISGLVLALCSFMLLQTINPALVNPKALEVKLVEEIINGCCENSGKLISGSITEGECKEKQGTWGGKDTKWDSVKKTCNEGPVGCCIWGNDPEAPSTIGQDNISQLDCEKRKNIQGQFYPDSWYHSNFACAKCIKNSSIKGCCAHNITSDKKEYNDCKDNITLRECYGQLSGNIYSNFYRKEPNYCSKFLESGGAFIFAEGKTCFDKDPSGINDDFICQ